jgi:hypothetical protein
MFVCANGITHTCLEPAYILRWLNSLEFRAHYTYRWTESILWQLHIEPKVLFEQADRQLSVVW